MKILTQNLKTGKTDILEVPSPSKVSKKIRVLNKFSLISTGTESSIVNFGKASWINKARQQPDRVKDVISKIKSSGIKDTIKAINNKLNYPMVMGYSSVGIVSEKNHEFNLDKGSRVFTNSFHQEEALVDYNMCIEIPDNVDDKSASFGALGGIAMQSIKCIPKESKVIAIIGLGLLGQITQRILTSIGYKCIVFDIDIKKVELAERNGAIGIKDNQVTESILNLTKGNGVDCTIIAAASLSSNIVNDATAYTKRKGKIVSSGLIGLDLIRDKFFKKQIELVVSNSSGDKNHRGKGSSYENISYFFHLIASKKVKVLDLISDEISIENADDIYSFPNETIFFSRIIKYNTDNYNAIHTFKNKTLKNNNKNVKVGLIGVGNFALSTLIPLINSTNNVDLISLLAREGLSLHVAQKKYNIQNVTTNDSDFYDGVDAVFIATPHETHFDFINRLIELKIPVWIEKPLVISKSELIDIRRKMLSNPLVYVIGYNRSLAPWTKSVRKKINFKKTKINITVNAGILPLDHWLLNKNISGGRIIGEFCHFIDLSLTLLNHTKLLNVKCIRRDKYYQDSGKYILKFEDLSEVIIDYRHDLPASVPKEKIEVNLPNKKLINNNWKKFSTFGSPTFKYIKKGKGHREAIEIFLNRVKNNTHSSEKEINQMCFSTYTSIKLQEMNEGDTINILESYKNEITSNI